MEKVNAETLVFRGIETTENGILGEAEEVLWNLGKVPFVAPFMKLLVNLCLIMTLMLFADRVYMAIVKLFVKMLRRKPEKQYKWEAVKEDDLEAGNSAYPMVLVQIPMFNEKEVYQLSIGAACSLSWPSDRIIIQVLDDSTDASIKDMVEVECMRWASKGMNIKYEIRDNRNGYKAGALKQGLKRSYVEQCEFVAIFDADFQPEPDFLLRTIPFFVHNPEIGLVQARWKFGSISCKCNATSDSMIKFSTRDRKIKSNLPYAVNSDECLMTRMQEMSLNYHFIVEQEVGSQTYSFFGFNGTAGVWRIATLNEAGGWNDRTTVEDMDLAVRATLKGWKFVFVGDIQVKSELPSTFKAFRYQQHRWSCGPANLFRKMAKEIAISQKVNLWKKLYILYSFFFIRKILGHITTFTFYCVVLPACVFFPEIEIPKWGTIYIPTVITILNAIGTLRSLHLVVFWVLFENVMAMHRTIGTFIGLLEVARVNEWVVTEKLGDALKLKATTSKPADKKPSSRNCGRFYWSELVVAVYLLICGIYDIFYGHTHYYIYILLQSIAFFVIGFGYIGTIIPNN